MQVLVVEDDGVSRAFIENVLRSFGDDVTACPDAESGWEAFQRSSPRLLVLDWILPGMSGLDLCRRIRSSPQGSQCVVLIATVRNKPEDLQAVLEAGADDYVTKPLDRKLLHIRIAIARQRVEDLRQRAEAKDRLRASEERYRLIAENVSDVIWTAKFDSPEKWLSGPPADASCDEASDGWRFTFFSPSITRLLGYTPAEACRLRLEQILESRSCERTIAALSQELDDERLHPNPLRQRTMEIELIAKDGSTVWCEAINVFLRDAAGQPIGVLGVARDIRERHQAERKLRESEERWRSLIAQAPDIILQADLQGTIKFINRTVPGFTVEGTIGTSMFDYIRPDFHDQVRQAFEKVLATGEPEHYEVAGSGPEGHTAWYSGRAGLLRQGDRVVGVTMIATDVTARKRAELANLQKKQLLARLLEIHERERQLIAYEIHDGLVQYITGSLMHLEAFRASQGTDTVRAVDELERSMQLLRDSVAEGRRLISGLRPPVLDELGIVAAIEYLKNEAGQELLDVSFSHYTRSNRFAAPLESALFRIVQEALTNVRRHSQSSSAAISIIQTGDWLRLRIRDWGAGFDPRKMHHASFGLHGIRERARLLGGYAFIEAMPDQGMEILVELPVLLPEE